MKMEPRSESEIIERVQAIIEKDIRPYIEGDGGQIDFIRYAESVVYVQLSGACVGCPSSAITLKAGVERAIRRRVPEVKAVELDSMEPVDIAGTPEQPATISI
jgi:Fe-S cluster biogenesis protein NfuA